MDAAWTERYFRALDAAHEAGRLALDFFDSPITVEWKDNATPVTVADRAAEELLRTRLLSRFKQDGFLGEESGEVKGSSGFRWIIDPIDGTRSFVRGIPIWATLLGLEFNGDPIAGICFLPAMQQTYRALRGDGAYRNERRLQVSKVNDLKESQLFYSSMSWFIKAGAKDTFMDLVARTQRQRGFGDFYGFMLVAQGSGELMVEYGVSPWDIAALMPIIEEAGGKVTDWEGTRTINRRDIIASNSVLHDTTLQLLNGAVASARATNLPVA
jgi:histidinol-phosphatase